MKKLLFLDDIRIPLDCSKYMIGPNTEIYKLDINEWNVVRSYQEFVDYIEKEGVPDFISFDHDLSDEHYSTKMYENNDSYNELYKDFKEKTGYDCAKWLLNYCSLNSLPIPEFNIHSMNPVGRENIKNIFESYKKFEERMS